MLVVFRAYAGAGQHATSPGHGTCETLQRFTVNSAKSPFPTTTHWQAVTQAHTASDHPQLPKAWSKGERELELILPEGET
jgi:hypothetical protein